MRKIDYFVGVPLCLGLTWFYRLFINWWPQRPIKPQRVVLIELSEMGSAVLVDPAMEKLKYQGMELFFAIFKKNKASLEILGTVPDKNIFLMRDNGILVLAWDTLRFLFWCRRNKIDSTIDLELFSRFTALLTALCGSRNNVGFYKFHNEGLYRGDFLTRKVAYNPHIHIAKNFVALVNALVSENEELPYSKIPVTDKEVSLKRAIVSHDAVETVRDKVRQTFPSWSGQSLFLINANASDMLPQRRWPTAEFIRLIQILLSDHNDILVLLTGSPAERVELDIIANGVNSERCINFAGKVKFEELIPLYSISTLMVSNDSGPPHFASVTDLHSFVLFGPETPSLYCSLGSTTTITAGLACSPCVSAWNHRKTPCLDNQCLKQIAAEKVAQLVSKYYLDSRSGQTTESFGRGIHRSVVLD
jgi:ADP-heptose:LPS heptosyltransferase